MLVTKPDFYNKFKCIAADCKDNCCTDSWEVEIDDFTMCKYAGLEGKIGKRLKESICDDDRPHFIFNQDGRCPFLNKDNLCELYITLGEDGLCDICYEHPRFYEWYGDRKDAGLGLCCEEVVRLFLSDENPLTFVTEITDEETDEDTCDCAETAEEIMAIRNELYAILENRKKPFKNRLIEAIESFDFPDDKPRTGSFYHTLTEYCEKCEPYDDEWNRLIWALKKDKDVILRNKDNCKEPTDYHIYERLICYFIFRYLIKSIEGVSKEIYMLFSCTLLLLIRVCDILSSVERKTLSTEDRIDIIRYLSKQIEYDEDNIMFFKKYCERGKFNASEIKRAIEILF